jgi:hypothetical protein
MVSDILGMILKDLESYFKCPLKPDANHSCLVKLPSGVKIQIELDRREENLVIGCNLGTLPAGSFKNNILRQALKANGLPPPLYGILAFTRSETLILFARVPINHINMDQLTTLLNKFIEKAQTWSTALAQGNIPELPLFENQQSRPNLFGLIR